MGLYNINMKKKGKKIRKSELIGRELEERVNKIFGKPNNNKATETLLKSIADKKTGEEVRKATERFLKSLQGKDFKPLFS